MPRRPSRKLTHFTESIIREMTRVANQHGAVNLSQGFPDFDPPQDLVEAAVRALRSGYNQYGLTSGIPEFRAALAEKQSHFMGMKIDPEEHLTATCGSTEAMLAGMMTVLNPGDRVILFSPVYENYLPDTILSGAVPHYVPLHPPHYELDPGLLREAFQAGARALILCNPSNPTGKVFTRDELNLIANLAREFDAYVITDEVYEHIVYPPHEHIYFSSLPGMFERAIACGSLSKTYAVTGWRLGYTVAPPELTTGIRKVHDFVTIAAPTPLQKAAVTALKYPLSYYHELREAYLRRKTIFLEYLERIGIPYTEPRGAYYVMVDLSRLGFDNDTELCTWLTREIGVAGVPGDSFFPTGDRSTSLVRFHFAKSAELLHSAGERLLQLKEHMVS